MTPYYDKDGITIYHGDFRNVLPLIEADVMVTDPPYGTMNRSSRNGSYGECEIQGDESTKERDDALAMWDGRPAIVFGSPRIPQPTSTIHTLIWDKGEHVGMGDLSFPWKPNYEEIYIIGYGWTGRRTGSVLKHNAIAGTVATSRGRHHPTEKPVSIMQALLMKCGGRRVVDPFMGSGTTLLAARSLGMNAIGIEVKEEYCETAVRRFHQSILFPLESE